MNPKITTESKDKTNANSESGVYSPNHACWSPCTSMARPKSANLTAAPFNLLAKSKFSGFE